MIRTLRFVLSTVSVLLLALGYAASQWAYFQGPKAAAAYAKKVDTEAIRNLALLLLVASITLAFIKSDRERVKP